jgi:hypothetical protein
MNKLDIDNTVVENDIDDVISKLLENVPAAQVRSLITFARSIELYMNTACVGVNSDSTHLRHRENDAKQNKPRAQTAQLIHLPRSGTRAEAANESITEQA